MSKDIETKIDDLKDAFNSFCLRTSVDIAVLKKEQKIWSMAVGGGVSAVVTILIIVITEVYIK